MRAAVITRPGGPEVLEIRDVADPEPGPGEVLIRVRASALNRADLLQREGRYPAPPGSPADIPGLELAGEVVAHGPGGGARRWRGGAGEGDRVFGIVGGGGNAELAVTHQDALAAVPDALSWDEAGAVPEAFITAHDALVTQAGLRAGERVLIHAVGSGVGLAAVQLVRALGAHAFGTARSGDKIDRARALGLEDGVVVGDDPGSFVPETQRWSDGRGMDVVLDLVGGGYTGASVRACAARGRVMLIGTIAGAEATIPLRMMLGKRITLRGTVLRSRAPAEKVAATEAFARDVVPMLADGRVHATVDRVFALDDVRAAHEYLESNASFGKVVVRT